MTSGRGSGIFLSVSGARPDPAAESIATDEKTEHRVRPRFVVDAPAVSKAETAEERRKRNAHPDNRAARREYMSTPEGRAANRKAQENYREAHPERVAAQQKARTTHGESDGSNHKCAKCDARGTHKHHTDYSGGPVQWLCHTHHVKAHHPKSDLGKSMTIKTDAALEPLAKCDNYSSSGNWYDKYYGTALYAEALQVERDYIARDRSAPEFVAPKKAGPSPWEKYDEARRKLEIKALDLKIKEAKKVEKSMTSNDLFKSIMGRDPFETGPTDLAKAMPPWLKPKDGAKPGAKDGDDDKDTDDPKASPEDKKKAFAAKFKKSYDAAQKALAEAAAMRKSDPASVGGGMTSVPMVDHPRPGASSTQGSGGEDPSKANTTTVPMVDHPRPGGGGAMDKSAKKEPDVDDAYAEAMGKARAAMDECMKSFVAYAALGDGLGTSGAAVGATTPGAGQSMTDDAPYGGAMHGMPSPDQGTETQLSEDDTSIASELSPGQKPLAAHAPGQGSAQLESSVNQTMSKSGALAPSYEYAKALAERRQGLSRDSVRAIVGSGSEDERIAGVLAKAEAAGHGLSVQHEPVQIRPRRVEQVYRPALIVPNE